MSDLKKLARGFFEGRLIWISGPLGTRKTRMAYHLLSVCDVPENEVLEVEARDFVLKFVEKLPLQNLKGTRVVVVKNLDEMAVKKSHFSKTVRLARRLFFTCGIRFIFISHDRCDWAIPLTLDFPMIRVRVAGCQQDNLDERVHWALELACKIAKKSVSRLEHGVALHLERGATRWNDDGLIEELTAAVIQSAQGVLRLEDFIRSDILKKGPRDPDLTVCN